MTEDQIALYEHNHPIRTIDEDEASDYILGVARAIEEINIHELRKSRLGSQKLQLWCNCFIKVLIANKLNIEQFLVIYEGYLTGKPSRMRELKILPERLIKNRRLGIKYIEGLMYATFKRDIRGITNDILK